MVSASLERRIVAKDTNKWSQSANTLDNIMNTHLQQEMVVGDDDDDDFSAKASYTNSQSVSTHTG